MGISSELPCSIADVVDLLGIQVIRNTGTQLHCRCPFCNDRKSHFNVKLSSNVYRCNRCGKGGGVLSLYAEFNNISMGAAYEELCDVFLHGEKRNRTSKCDTPRSFYPIMVPEEPIASAEVRDNTYSNLMSILSLGSRHRESLLARGLSNEAIDVLGYKTTPAVRLGRIVTELLERGCNLSGVPGFYRDKESGGWKLDIRASGILIPDRNQKGQIEAIQIRLDNAWKSKFNTLTSVDQYYGTAAQCCPHHAGNTDGTDTLYLTEGVMKSDIAQFLSSKLGQPRQFVGLTGASNFNQFRRLLEEAKAAGIRRIMLAYDMDALTNETVQSARDRILKEGYDAGFEMTLLSWDAQYKGIDDLLHHFTCI